jgi:hypothetical protein
MAKDVAAFLTWTAEPKMESTQDRRLGSLLFLIIVTTTLAYMSYRNIWADNQALSLGPDRLKQRGGSARSRPFSCRWLGMPLIPTKVFGGALYACRFLLSC